MRNLLLSTLPLAVLISACTPQDGHYDANGNYVAPYNAVSEERRLHSPDPAASYDRTDYTNGHYDRTNPRVYKTTTTVYTYDRPGYYDYNGYYITDETGMVPQDMFPPRGMCRVWFPDRAPEAQPAVESCDGIRHRIPAGSYVIYGG